MNQSSIRHSKLTGTYSRLFQGHSPFQISPNDDPKHFYSNLLGLDINREFLVGELKKISKESCLGNLKPTLNTLFLSFLEHARSETDSTKRGNAFETLSIMTRCILAKNLSGWEAMEIFAGGTDKSDTFFMLFATVIDEALLESSIPESVRHQALQLALVFMCGVGQLSPGAYFLRKDLFLSLTSFMKAPGTERFTFEAALLLAILANFHKSDAAKLNPYLQRIKETDDTDLMKKICWAANFALDTTMKAYQEIYNDEPETTFSSTLGSLLASMRPDRALSSTPVDPPRELFKDQPIEACVILLPLYEFARANTTFNKVMIESITESEDLRLNPMPFTILSLSSYLLSHATSTSSTRSLAYANLCLNFLLALTENDDVMEGFSQPTKHKIRLCRQRLPLLPVSQPGLAPVCAVLDCCILWLRHNLHKRLEVQGYINCIWILYRVVWYLSTTRTKIEYDWKELWRAVLGLLSFLSAKLDSLFTTGGVEKLIRETIILVELSLAEGSSFFLKPQYLHEFIYELVRNRAVLEKQVVLLRTLAIPTPIGVKQDPWVTEDPETFMESVISATKYYESKITMAGARSAKDGIRVVSREVDRDGLSGFKSTREFKSASRTQEVIGFARVACSDVLALLP